MPNELQSDPQEQPRFGHSSLVAIPEDEEILVEAVPNFSHGDSKLESNPLGISIEPFEIQIEVRKKGNGAGTGDSASLKSTC